MPTVLAVLRNKRRSQRFRRGVYLLPSMFTVGNLFCGYACIVPCHAWGLRDGRGLHRRGHGA